LKKILGIDLFAGAGGMSVGAQWAGIDVELAIEIDRNAAYTYGYNHKYTKVVCDDIKNFQNYGISKSKRKHGIIVFGGPPCQGFSTSNQKTRSIDNINNWLFEEYFRVVKMINPDWVVFENVTGIIGAVDGFFLNHILNKLSDLGYSTDSIILNAQDHGVPQRRARLFIVASKSKEKIKIFRVKKNLISVEEAISDLPFLENGAKIDILPYRDVAKTPYQRKMRGNRQKSANHLVTRNFQHIIDRYEHIKQGENWQNIPIELMSNYSNVSNCHTGIYYRLKANEPSIVIGNFRKNMLIHPNENRGLSVREAARLQSFPDGFIFQGSIGFQQQQVGNAVPPLLANTVFQAIFGNQEGTKPNE
jgi:DNA (cytosine-5)-methyltransferase 1